ncbi:MAG: helix-turn-helix domain-containing protein [Candidatus Paceibacterota bacterium]|jgi:sugar-specific transcriptional regulator TrmB
MKEEILKQVGLTAEQSKIYLFLIENGLCNARIASLKTGIGRALVYKVLDQLVGLNLAEKRDDIGKVSFYKPKHPSRLKELIQEKKSTIERANSALDMEFSNFSSSFNMLSGKPNVQYYEGEEGLKNIYADILEVGQNIMIISSPVARDDENLKKIFKEQILKQAKNNIKVKAITPLKELTKTKEEDDEVFIERKMIPMDKLNIPAQIIIYGDKIAITNFKESMITVLIESNYIAETFRTIFNFMWGKID